MPDLTCHVCGHENKAHTDTCANCNIVLDRTISNRHNLAMLYENMEESTIIPDSAFDDLQKALAAKKQAAQPEPEVQAEDDVVETPSETLRVNMESEEVAEASFGRLAVVGDLILTHKASNTQFRIPHKQLDEVVIGRKQNNPPYDPTVDLTIINGLEQGVSRRHATLMKKQGYMVIIDHQSKNGTYLNGLRITPEQPRVIRDKDTIRLGLIFLLVEYQSE